MSLKAMILGSTALSSPTLAHLVPEELASARDEQIEVLGICIAEAFREAYGREATASELARMIVALDTKGLTSMDLAIATGMMRHPSTPIKVKAGWMASLVDEKAAPVIH